MKITIMLFIIVSISAFIAQASVINVPADQPTIQTGIDAASNGDTVLVADGLYLENIDFMGKAITVTSRFLMDGDTSHISNTIIDGSQPSNPDSGSVVYFISGEDTTSVLCGFTITGGSGTFFPVNNNRLGGGICALNSSAHIKYNDIVFNIINNTNDALGAGIYAERSTDKDFIIEYNMIRHNSLVSAISTVGSIGAGIKTYTDGTETIRISNNRIHNNSITAPIGYGGGLAPSNAGSGTYVITNNIISGNVLNVLNGASGGVDIYNHYPILRNNVISYNSAPYGGGIGIEFTSGKTSQGERGGSGTINLHNDYTQILNFSNNTLYGNSATVQGGGIAILGSIASPHMINFIVWRNGAPSDPQIFVTALADVQYSNVEGGFTGSGNINSEPLFIDTTSFFLSENSPCIDAGNPDSIYNDSQDPNNPGSPLWPAMGTPRNDMGAFGGPGVIGWDLITGIEDGKSRPNRFPTQFNLQQNYPNPFNPVTTISWQLAVGRHVKLEIYNITGQRVALLVAEKQTAGLHSVVWNASNLTSGVYLYRLQAGEYVETRKMVLMK